MIIYKPTQIKAFLEPNIRENIIINKVVNEIGTPPTKGIAMGAKMHKSALAKAHCVIVFVFILAMYKKGMELSIRKIGL